MSLWLIQQNMTKLPYPSFARDCQGDVHFLVYNQAGEEGEDFFYFKPQKVYFFIIYLFVCLFVRTLRL